MVRKTVTVELASGLEARPVAMLVQVASQYESNIYVEIDSKRVNAKSIMGMMTLGFAAENRLRSLRMEPMRNRRFPKSKNT